MRERCCIVVLYKSRKLFLALIFRDGFWVYFAFLDEPGVEFVAFGEDAVEQLVREVAFTHLNRFCAYKMMETRALIRKAVSDGLKSQRFLFYLAG